MDENLNDVNQILNVSQLNMIEIVQLIGFPVKISDYRHTYKYDNIDEEKIKSFEEKIKSFSEEDFENQEKIEDVISEYENIFDKDLYVFLMLIGLEEEIKNQKGSVMLEIYESQNFIAGKTAMTDSMKGRGTNAIIMGLRRSLINAKKLLKESDVVIIRKNSDTNLIEVQYSIDYNLDNQIKVDINKKERKENAEKRLDELKSKIDLKQLIKKITPEDLIKSAYYQNVGKCIVEYIYKEDTKQYNQDELENFIINYPECFDFEKLFSSIDVNENNNIEIIEDKEEVQENLENENEDFLEITKQDTEKKQEKQDCISDISKEKLVELYLQNNQEEFVKYKNLYKKFVIDKSERKKELDTMLLETSDELLDINKLQDLYSMGLLQLETLKEYISFDEMKKLLGACIFKPYDVRLMYNSNEITDELLKQIVEDENIDMIQKIVFIYSTFANEQNKSKIEELIANMKYMYTKEKNSESAIRKIGGILKNKTCALDNEKPIAPSSRWNLASLIDEKYSQKYLEDGNIIFYFPNKGKVLIEKLCDKNQKTAYGAESYILSESYFRTNYNEIIIDNKLNKNHLLMAYKKSKDVDRIVHIGWGRTIIKYFGLDDPTERSEEEINVLKQIVNVIEKEKMKINYDSVNTVLLSNG